jgi:ubiquitin C-terminal hydrolase
MDFVGRHIFEVRIESAAPSQLKDVEAWRCEKCAKQYVDTGDGSLHETEQLPSGSLP